MEIPAHLLRDDVTAQELFDHSVRWMRNHPQCRTDDIGVCTYRSSDNQNGCAVGCLMTDEECAAIGSRIMGVESLKKTGLLPPRLLPHTNLLYRLQAIHDDSSGRNNAFGGFEARVKTAAEDFLLAVPT